MNVTADTDSNYLAPSVLPFPGEDMEKISIPSKPVLTSSDKVAFSAILEGAAANPTLCVIANRYPWQARIAAHKLLQIARYGSLPIRVLSGRCHEGFYDKDFAAQLQDCKDNGCVVRILVWQASPECISPDLIKLSETGVIELRLSGTEDFENEVPHFMLVGDSAFRQEAGHPPFNKNTTFSDDEPQVPARIDFNDPATGKVLSAMFDNLWGAA
jgi:hypothetical protein